LLNARVGIDAANGKWSASLWARNLTDEFYTTNTIRNSDVITRYVGMPRTYGITLKFWFQ
jgi:outer membrane receptor protein involved in Fe transport